mmetsp:Transcript_57733/g.122492  ORF Transcript_57733/g.122492 Transcript_57733/m.122492 type:complete len:438 (-) Transcript_57733:111-1424(-)
MKSRVDVIMKSRVDIFRPLAAATRGCRPESATSIFRRNNKKLGDCGNGGGAADDDDESFVVSVPAGDWPPHRAALSSKSEGTCASSPQKELRTSAPLPAGTTSTSEDRAGSPLGASASARRTTFVTPRPSYYKIELDPDNENVVQLTAGDDSSVQFTPEVHNKQIRMVTDESKKPIVRASPVVEPVIEHHEAIEHEIAAGSAKVETIRNVSDDGPVPKQPHQSMKWTVSDSGRIMAIPPSPSEVCMTHDKSSSPVKSGKKGRKGGYFGSGDDEDLSIPPMLVKANSGGSSSSQESECYRDDACDESCLATNSLMHGGANRSETPDEEGAEIVSLESPPRMTRAVVGQSLFQDSIGSSSREGSQCSDKLHVVKTMSQVAGSNKRSNSSCSNGSAKHGGGCGTRAPLDWLLDVFSLNGPCCNQQADGAGVAPLDSMVCR